MQTAIELFQQLIRIDSVNGNEGAVAAVLADYLKAHGANVQLIENEPGRVNLVADIGHGQPILAFTGHADVVSASPVSGWHTPPFAGAIHDRQLFGRGSVDMRGGLAAMTVVLAQLADEHFAGHVRLIVTIGEEYGAAGSRQLTQLGVVDDISALVVGEPTDDAIEYAHAGSLNYKIHSAGVAVHSSRPEAGQNALEPLADFMLAERQAFDDAPIDPIIGPLVHSVTVINGGAQVNTIPDAGWLAGNIRPTPSFDNQAVINRLEALVVQLNQQPQTQLTFELTHSFVPVYTPVEKPIVKLAQQIGQNYLNAVPLHISHGATDASEFTKSPHQFDTIIFGPGDNHLSHQLDEHIDLDDFENFIRIYHDLAVHYFS